MVGALFPGQGSQKVGMGQFLYEEFSIAKEVFEEASDTLSIDFKKLCFTDEGDDLNLTANTQPALLLVSTATYRVLKETVGFAPKVGAGHSVGEYAAAVNSGALAFSHGLSLVRRRGELMQDSVPVGEGGMLAVLGLEDAQVTTLCQWAEKESGLSPVEPANYNSPGQVVISGSSPLIQWIRENFKPEVLNLEGKKVRLIPLKVSAPFHCSMMKIAEQGMAQALEDISFQDSQWPIAQNIHGQLVTKGSEIKANLIQQITGAVKWTHCMESLKKQGVERLVECGPGKVLAGLQKKIDGSMAPCLSVQSLEDLKILEAELK